MARRLSFDWREPGMILGAWIIGLALCVGHFLFYNSLAGTTLDDTLRSIAGYHYTAQQLNLAIGTTFAFLVKSAFVLAASTAYFFLFWRTILKRSTSKQLPVVSQLDATFAALNNLISIFQLPLWTKYPSLLSMALIIWLLPIPSLVTPATLSVTFGPAKSRMIQREVPSINFATLSYLAGLEWYGTAAGPNFTHLKYNVWNYNGPSQLVNKLALAVATQGTILPVSPSYANSTWQMQFHGPSLQCNDYSAAELKVFMPHMISFLAHLASWVGGLAPTYYSWLQPPGNFTGPFSTYDEDHWSFNDGANIFYSDPGAFMPEPILSVAIFPSASQYEGSQRADNSTVIKCRFVNSTYLVDFDTTNGNQTITAHTIKDATNTPKRMITQVQSIRPSDNNSSNCLRFTPYSATDQDACRWNPGTAETMAYQALLQAYTSLIVGTNLDGAGEVQMPGHSYLGFKGGKQTRALTTVLMRAKEMQYLSDVQTEEQNTLQGALATWNTSAKHMAAAKAMSGLPALNLSQVGSQTSLKDALESMFMNLTISLMSEPVFRNGGPGTGTTPRYEQVTTYPWENTYVFAFVPLIAAYAAAAVLSLLVVVIGLSIIVTTRTTYNRDFSTLLRIARGADLSTEIHEEDLDGRSPLPKYLANAKVRIRGIDSASKKGEDEGKESSTDSPEGLTLLTNSK